MPTKTKEEIAQAMDQAAAQAKDDLTSIDSEAASAWFRNGTLELATKG